MLPYRVDNLIFDVVSLGRTCGTYHSRFSEIEEDILVNNLGNARVAAYLSIRSVYLVKNQHVLNFEPSADQSLLNDFENLPVGIIEFDGGATTWLEHSVHLGECLSHQ